MSANTVVAELNHLKGMFSEAFQYYRKNHLLAVIEQEEISEEARSAAVHTVERLFSYRSSHRLISHRTVVNYFTTTINSVTT